MSAAPQLSLAAMSTSATRVATQVPLDSQSTEDLYEVWKSVFERARAVEVSRDEARPRAADWEDLEGSDHHGDASMGRARGPHDGARPPVVPGICNPTVGRIGAASAATNASSNEITNVARAAFAAATSPLAVQAQMSQLLVAPQSASNAISRNAVAATQPAPAELVNVFVHGAAVTIVVRDAGLSPEKALHCAFATARELIGEGAALYQLTLNGRTVYQRSDVGANGPTHEFEQPESLLAFAC
jgi:hypothetical protein